MGSLPSLFLVCYLIFLLPFGQGASLGDADDFDPVKFVDPLIGTVGGGSLIHRIEFMGDHETDT
jgi:hypothetical protein